VIAADDVRLVQETVEALRARGEDERARAVETLLDVALSAQARPSAVPEREYLTTGQAANVLGVSRQTIVNWVAAGRLQGVRVGGRTMVHREAVRTHLEALRATRLPVSVRTPEAIEAERRWSEHLLADLPADKVARLEALHAKMEDGQRPSRAERTEMVALEREVTLAASQRLEEWIRSSRSTAP
jgi:excisionase family DNA binding protein